jgi:hypothetical protein
MEEGGQSFMEGELLINSADRITIKIEKNQ